MLELTGGRVEGRWGVDALALRGLPGDAPGDLRVRVAGPAGELAAVVPATALGAPGPDGARALALSGALAPRALGAHAVEVEPAPGAPGAPSGARAAATIVLARPPRRATGVQVGPGAQRSGLAWALARGEDGGLAAWRWAEDSHGLERGAPRAVPAPPGAAPLATSGAFPREGIPVLWQAWWAPGPGGGALGVVPSLAHAPGRLELADPLLAVVEPALATRRGGLAVHVLLLRAGRVELGRVELDPPGPPPGPVAPRLAWTVPVPVPVEAARAAIGPTDAGAADGAPGGPGAAVVVAGSRRGPDGAEVLVVARLAVEPTGAPGAWDVVELPGVTLATWADGDARLGPRGAEALFPCQGPDGALGAARAWWWGPRGRAEVLPLAGPGLSRADAATVRFDLLAGRDGFSWAALLPDGRVQGPRGRGGRPPAAPTPPLELLPLDATWLVLAPEAEGPRAWALPVT